MVRVESEECFVVPNRGVGPAAGPLCTSGGERGTEGRRERWCSSVTHGGGQVDP